MKRFATSYLALIPEKFSLRVQRPSILLFVKSQSHPNINEEEAKIGTAATNEVNKECSQIIFGIAPIARLSNDLAVFVRHLAFLQLATWL